MDCVVITARGAYGPFVNRRQAQIWAEQKLLPLKIAFEIKVFWQVN